MRAAIYTRISRDTEGLGLGVARQEKDCRELVATRGWEVAGVYSDNDISAYSGKTRPGYEALLADVEAGLVDALVAWHPDRLHRSPKELERFIDLIEARGTAVATVQAGTYDLTTPAGRLQARIVGATARYESEHKSARLRAKAAQLAQEGKLGGGGTRPFGYEDDRRTVRESEAAEIRDAVRRLLGGHSAYAVVTDWQARGVTTPTGRKWMPSVWKRMVLSPRIAGLREYRGKVVGPAEWEGIITEADHYALVALFADKARRPAGRRRAYLLTGGIVVCGLCGAGLVSRPTADKRRTYTCASGPLSGCGKISAMADPVEELLRDLIVARLAGPELAKALANAKDQKADQSPAMRELATVEAKLTQLAADFAADRIGHSEWLTARDALAARAEALKSQIAKQTSSVVVAGLPTDEEGLRGRWDSEPMEWRRRLVGLLVQKVTIGPAPVRGRPTFDPRRVTVSWRV